MKRAPLLLALLTAACSSNSSTGPTNPCTGGATNVDLTVGQVQSFSGAQAGCFAIASGGQSGDYAVVVANDAYGSTQSFGFTLTGASNAVAGLASKGLLRSAATSAAASRARLTLGRTLNTAAHDRLQRMMRSSDLGLAAARQARATGAGQIRRANVTRAVPAVGSIVPLKVAMIDSSTNAICTRNAYVTVGARVRYVSTHAIIVQDTLAPSGGFVDADFQAFGTEFDQFIYPTDSAYFGEPTDFDNKGKIFILFTPQVNALTPKGSTSYTGGFFNYLDMFPATGTNGCAASNDGEIFYMLVPDPNGAVTITINTAEVRQVSRGVLAHEFQHMINAGNRVKNPNANAFEALWLDESLAHSAEEFVGRSENGYADQETLTSALIQANADDYRAFYAQNVFRFHDWLDRPDTTSPINSDAVEGASSLPYRGAGWAMLRHTADQFNGGDVRAFYRSVVAGPDTGVTNLTSKAQVSFDSLYGTWLIANAPVASAGVNSVYTYVSWDWLDVFQGVVGGYPLTINSVTTSTSDQFTLQPGAAAYFERLPSGPTSFKVTAPSGSPLTANGAKVWIFRVG